MHLQMNSCQNKEDNIISLENVTKSYNNEEVLKEISIYVSKGEFVSILGPSGCGKSTLFNIITGLVPQDEGNFSVKGNIGYMQQKDMLLPWKTILDNVVLPLDLKGLSRKASRDRANEYFDIMGLKGYEEKYPYELSGGMKQRASFLRTFLSSEEIMLLDEPFGALDAITKGKMQKWLLEMKNILNNTIVFITHDIEEAIFMSDRIYVMSSKPGTIQKEFFIEFFKENKHQRLVSEKLLKLKEEIISIL